MNTRRFVPVGEDCIFLLDERGVCIKSWVMNVEEKSVTVREGESEASMNQYVERHPDALRWFNFTIAHLVGGAQ